MSNKNTSSSNSSNLSSSNNTNINNQQQDFNESVNRSLDQTKDNINRSIQESINQIPQFNNIVNSYQEQTLQTVKEISENFIESQKTIIRSIQSAWSPYQQNFNNKVNTCMSPEAAANEYSRFVSNVADNAVSTLRTTNNIIFSSIDSMKTVLQQAKDNSKQIFNQNVNAAKTFEQNSKEVARAAQDVSSRFNASIDNNSGSSGNTTGTSTTSSSAA
jgi:gas vesicle protein